MPRSKAEIEAEIERLQSELNDSVDDVSETAEELEEVLEEAVEATEEAIEDAAEEASDEIEEAIEEAAAEVVEESPIIDSEPDAEAAVAARVIEQLESRYELSPRVEVIEEHHISEAPAESAPRSEHWSRRRIF